MMTIDEYVIDNLMNFEVGERMIKMIKKNAKESNRKR